MINYHFEVFTLGLSWQLLYFIIDFFLLLSAADDNNLLLFKFLSSKLLDVFLALFPSLKWIDVKASRT
jgi:hypothetical protein